MDALKQKYISHIDRLLEMIPNIRQSISGSSGFGEFIGDKVSAEQLRTECYELLYSIHGTPEHPTIRIVQDRPQSPSQLDRVEGVLKGTRSNIENGLIDDLIRQITVDIKTDFLASAQQLLDEQQKDPAAVLACIVLEDTLKRLAQNNGIDADSQEMSKVVQALLTKKVIEKSTAQAIQGFKNLRNAALHAQWAEVSAETVGYLLVFLPTFIEKHGL